MIITRVKNENELELLKMYICIPTNKYLSFIAPCAQDESTQKYFHSPKEGTPYTFKKLKEIYLMEGFDDF